MSIFLFKNNTHLSTSDMDSHMYPLQAIWYNNELWSDIQQTVCEEVISEMMNKSLNLLLLRYNTLIYQSPR